MVASFAISEGEMALVHLIRDLYRRRAHTGGRSLPSSSPRSRLRDALREIPEQVPHRVPNRTPERPLSADPQANGQKNEECDRIPMHRNREISYLVEEPSGFTPATFSPFPISTLG
jgi:hypothetical protein